MSVKNTDLGGTDWVDAEVLTDTDLNDTFDELFTTNNPTLNTSTGHGHDGVDSKLLSNIFQGSESNATEYTSSVHGYVTVRTYGWTNQLASGNIFQGPIVMNINLKTTAGDDQVRCKIILTDDEDNLLATSNEATSTSSGYAAKVLTISEATLLAVPVENEAGYKIKTQVTVDTGVNGVAVNNQVLSIKKVLDSIKELDITQS